MFIYVIYKDIPELSDMRLRMEELLDPSVEKTLLVNPKCPVRIMLEFIRKECKLGIYTNFDLCDDTGILKRLFDMRTYDYPTERFEHRGSYYIVVLKEEKDKTVTVLPQLNRNNVFYSELKAKVQKCLREGTISTGTSSSSPLGKKVQLKKSSSTKKKIGK